MTRFLDQLPQWLRPTALLALLLAGWGMAPAQAFLRPVPNLNKPVPQAKAAPEPAAPQVRGSEQQAEQNRYYDPANPGYFALQKANEALAGFPVDRQGKVDWMKALSTGQIKPLADIHGQTEMQPLDLDVLMTNTKDMPYVRFPHRSHTLWLECSNCHPVPFQPKAGGNAISMAEIFRGRYCGMCHDRVAFVTFFSCERCHAVPHAPMQTP